MILGFSQILKDYNDNEVTAAFQKWMREARELPTPSDILAICEHNKKHQRDHCPETMNARDSARQREQRRIKDIRDRASTAPMSPEEFSAWLKESKENIEGDDAKKVNPKRIDTKHFDRLTEQQKAEINKRAISSARSGKYEMR